MAESRECFIDQIENESGIDFKPEHTHVSHDKINGQESIPGLYIGTYEKCPFYYSVYLKADEKDRIGPEFGEYLKEGNFQPQLEFPLYVDEDGNIRRVSELKNPPGLYCPSASQKQRHRTIESGSADDDDAKPNKILITNLPSLFHTTRHYEEFLEILLQFKIKDDADQAKVNVTVDEETSTAIVEFEDSDTLERMLQNRPFNILGTVVDVEIYPERFCIVEVRGPPDVLVDDLLELYFENTKRSGGDDIQNIEIEQMDDGDHVAFITFETEKVAKRVEERGEHIINKQQITVRIHKPDTLKVATLTNVQSKSDDGTVNKPNSLSVVEVRGPHDILSDDNLKQYFDKETNSDVNIVDVEVYEDVAYIIFNSEKVARAVAAKKNFLIHGKQVSVQLYKSRTNLDRENNPHLSMRTVKVRGIEEINCQDLVMFYFENRRRSGGGNVESLIIDNDDADIAYITFDNAEAAKTVASKTHCIDGVDLSVRLHDTPTSQQCYGDRVIIRGLKSATTKDCLFNFLEAKTKSVPHAMMCGKDDEVVMVTFKTNIDFDALERKVKHITLDGAILAVSRVPISHCVIVTAVSGVLKNAITTDVVHNYFENKYDSETGVENVVHQGDGSFLVYFMGDAVVDRVLKGSYVIEGQQINVNLYLEHIGQLVNDGENQGPNIPDSTVITSLEPQKIMLIKNSVVVKQLLERQLEEKNAKIMLPDNTSGEIIISCTLATDGLYLSRNANVKHWKQTVRKIFEDFISKIEVVQKRVTGDSWNKVMDELQRVNISDPDEIALLTDKDRNMITVVGIKHIVGRLIQDIDSIITQIEKETAKENLKVNEVVTTLKPVEVKMLQVAQFSESMNSKYQNLNVMINQLRDDISFEGMIADVRGAKCDMYEMVQGFCRRVIENNPQMRIDLYNSSQVKEYIMKKLKHCNVTAIWEVNGLDLILYSVSESGLNKCFEIIHECVVFNSVKVRTSRFLFGMHYATWQAKLDALRLEHTAKAYIAMSKDLKFVHIYSTDVLANEIFTAVKAIFRE